MKQDEHFQTKRIQIVVRSGVSHGSRWNDYAVVVRDVVQDPRQVEMVFVRDEKVAEVLTQGHWVTRAEVMKERTRTRIRIPRVPRDVEKGELAHIGWFGYEENVRWNSKERALKIAKREVEFLHLPFVSAVDVIDEEDIYKGPNQACVACGNDAGRSFQSKLCDACLTAWTAGKEVVGERPYHVVEHLDLIEYGHGIFDTSATSQKLAEALCQAMGVKLDKHEKYKARYEVASDITASVHGHDNWQSVIRVTNAQAEGFRQVMLLVNKVAAQAFASGQREGSAFVKQIATGKLTVDEINERAPKFERGGVVEEDDGEDDDDE